MLKKVAAILVASLALAGGARGADYKQEYKLSVVTPMDSVFGVAANGWADAVREKTNGRINIKIYPSAMLLGGEQTREFAALREGVIDMAIGAGISWSPQVKEFNVFSLPFLIPDDATADAAVAGPGGAMIFERLRNLGIEPLAWGDSAFRIVANAKLPIRKPEDFRGLKLRAIGSPLFTDFYTSLGANPTQMSAIDMQAALATGAIDGADQSVEGFRIFKLVTLKQKYLTLLNHCWEPLVFSVNKKVWEQWSADDQKIVKEAAVEQGDRTRQLKRDGLTAKDDHVLREIEASGAQVIQLTPEERAAFREATKAVYQKWAAQLNPALVAAIEKSAAEAGKK